MSSTEKWLQARDLCNGQQIILDGDKYDVENVVRRCGVTYFAAVRNGMAVRRLLAADDCKPFLLASTTELPSLEAIDAVKNQPHYTEGGIEPIDYMRAKLTPEQFEGFLIGNAIKYLSRARLKGEREKDYAKALWYVRALNGDDPRKESKS